MASVKNVYIGIGSTSILSAADWRLYSGPIWIKNESDTIQTVIVSGADPYDLDPGEPLQVLPGQIVTGSAVGGNKLLQIIAGIVPANESASKGPGVSAENPLYTAAVSSTFGTTIGELLDRLIIEMKINNLYNSRAHNEELTDGDLCVGPDYLV